MVLLAEHLAKAIAVACSSKAHLQTSRTDAYEHPLIRLTYMHGTLYPLGRIHVMATRACHLCYMNNTSPSP